MARVGKAGVRGVLEQTVRDRIGDASPEQVKWYLDSADGLTVEYLSRFVPLMASEDWTERPDASSGVNKEAPADE
jgi:hypothetical protein